ncbi:putative phage tail protein [Metabacillus fastidiosus]|uniref:DUF2313 domain-containing protein n=1 Tax=Metabacillus fastidiosus TaxID=1458 RepID=A0ABU6NRQ2_9BACI|nr:DUF2313 domain-containing protein [Metabacillus fastidiosus]
MIKVKQRMIDTLPSYYNESPEVDAIKEANAIEIERKRTEARDLLDQFFVNTAVWGLNDWERVLALSPMPHSSLEFRRQRILAKLNGTAPATAKYLTDLVNVYVKNKDARIVEYNSEYRFEAEIPLKSDINTDDIRQAVEEVKPAHLGFGISGTIEDIVSVTSREYSFEVPYKICNLFRTDDAKGIGINIKSTVSTREYGFDVSYLICGEFHAQEVF